MCENEELDYVGEVKDAHSWTVYLWKLFALDETTPTFAAHRTCLLMAWLEVFAVAMVMVADVSFMPRSLPERMQNV